MNKPLSHYTHKELIDLCKNYKVKYHGASKEEMVKGLKPYFVTSHIALKDKLTAEIAQSHKTAYELYENLTMKQRKAAPDVLRIMNALRDFKTHLCSLKY